MVEDRWYRLDIPILEFLDSRRLTTGPISARAIAEVVKADPEEVASELQRLCKEGYVDGRVHKEGGADMRQCQLYGSDLTGRGLRVVGAWPDDDPYTALLELLDRKIEATEDVHQKSKLQGASAREKVGGAGLPWSVVRGA